MVELRAMRFISDRIVQVGRATQVMANGEPSWLCEALPPVPRSFALMGHASEAAQWLRTECGADEVLSGAPVD